MIDQQRNVFLSIPQGRQLNFNRIDAIQQILPEFIFGDHLVDGHVGGAYQADIDIPGSV